MKRNREQHGAEARRESCRKDDRERAWRSGPRRRGRTRRSRCGERKSSWWSSPRRESRFRLGWKADVTKYMASSPRKIEKIEIRFWGFDQSLSDHQKKILERAARTCPVGLSLHSDIVQAISFEF